MTGVSYDSPTPIDRQLEALQLPLGEGATAIQLLAALRGSRVEVRGATGPSSPAGSSTPRAA